MDSPMTVNISSDASRASLLIRADLSPEAASVHDIIACVTAAGVVVSEEMREQFAQIAESFAAAPSDIDVEIAVSRPPVDGVDARIEWREGLDPTRTPEPVLNKNGTVDHYRQQHLVQVNEGDVLATVTAETPGEPGRDVRGRDIKPKTGRKLPLRFDEASTSLVSGELTARRTGVLQIVQGVVAVADLLEINSDVDFSTGNLQSRGSILVKGAVRDRFLVSAQKNIQIAGLVEAATLEAGGDIALLRGMAARYAGSIKAKGGLTVGFIDSCRIEIGGSLTLGREMINCDVTVGANIEGPSATVIGGIIRPTGAVRLGTVGSAGETPTTLRLGSAPILTQQRSEFENAIKAIERAVAQLREQAATLAPNGQAPAGPAGEALLACNVQLDEHLRRKAACEDAVLRLNTMIERSRRVEVRLDRVLHANVRIETDDTAAVIQRMIRGPVLIGWDQKRQLVISVGGGASRPISEFASVVRKAA